MPTSVSLAVGHPFVCGCTTRIVSDDRRPDAHGRTSQTHPTLAFHLSIQFAGAIADTRKAMRTGEHTAIMVDRPDAPAPAPRIGKCTTYRIASYK